MVNSTFIIRLWTTDEPLSGEPRRGRGRIDHVQSGEHIYFEQLDEALQFLRRHFGAFDSLEHPAAALPLSGAVGPVPDKPLMEQRPPMHPVEENP